MAKHISQKAARSLAVAYEAFYSDKVDGSPNPVWADALLDAQRATGVVLVDERILITYVPWRKQSYAVEQLSGAWCVVNARTKHVVRDWGKNRECAEREAQLLNDGFVGGERAAPPSDYVEER